MNCVLINCRKENLSRMDAGATQQQQQRPNEKKKQTMRSYSLMLLYIVQFSAHRQSHSTQSIKITMRRDSWGRHAPLSLGQLNENWLWKVNNNQLNQTTQLSARPPVHRAYFQTRRTILCVRSGRSKREKNRIWQQEKKGKTSCLLAPFQLKWTSNWC